MKRWTSTGRDKSNGKNVEDEFSEICERQLWVSFASRWPSHLLMFQRVHRVFPLNLQIPYRVFHFGRVVLCSAVVKFPPLEIISNGLFVTTKDSQLRTSTNYSTKHLFYFFVATLWRHHVLCTQVAASTVQKSELSTLIESVNFHSSWLGYLPPSSCRRVLVPFYFR